ncbi:hypothetical protein D047_1610A, partial [Vibrio parahaemolyticus VPTS-2010_2]
MQDTCLRS